MVTYAQLRTEPAWNEQFVPPNLLALAARLEAFYDSGVANIGVYGDNRHLKGYHRSRRWIRESRYCTNRTYSIVETLGNRDGGDSNWISAIDIILGQSRSEQVWRRVNAAKVAGRISYILQHLLERDPWHVHLSIDRAYANHNFDELYAIITGTPHPGGNTVSFQIEMPVLREGAEGSNVITAQALLNARGFETAEDGQFGTHTDSQTRAMQTRYGAEAVDGIWGPETWTIGITGEDRL